MKNIFNSFIYLFLVIAFLTTSCSEKTTYKVKGQIADIPDSSVILMYDWAKGESAPLDTAYAVGGQFQLNGTIENPTYVRLIIDTTPAVESMRAKKRYTITFFLEASNISINATGIAAFRLYPMGGSTDGSYKIEGSRNQKLYDNYQELLGGLRASNDSLNRLYMDEYFRPSLEDIINADRGVELVNQLDINKLKIREIAFDYLSKYKNEHSSVLIATHILLDNDIELTQDQIVTLMSNFDSFYPVPNLRAFEAAAKAESDATAETATEAHAFDPSVKPEPVYFFTKSKSALVNYLGEVAETKMVLANGNQYIDLNLQDREGNEVKLSDYIVPGKYNFIEFWASWCGPCRGEIPHLRHINDTFGERINFVSVSMDESFEAWHKAMEEEKMVWTQLVDNKGFFGEVTKKYRVLGIPYSVMIDPNGKLILGGLRGAYLDAALIRLLN